MNRICGYGPTFQDYEALTKTLPRNLELLEKMYIYDGRFPRFTGYRKDVSDDGTKELLQSFGHRVYYEECGVCDEFEKFNRAFHRIAKDGYKYVLLLGTDEWIDGDIYSFIVNLDSVSSDKGEFFNVPTT